MSFQEERLRRTSPIRSLQLGDLKISYVPDGVVYLKPGGWLPAATAQDWEHNAAHLDANGNLVATIGGLLIEDGERALLIDAGVGPVSLPDDPGNPLVGALRGGDLLDNLAKLGRRPEEIEAVAFTHLHPDHLGWAHHTAPGDELPAFTQAAYLFAEPEWTQQHLRTATDVTDEMLATLASQARIITDGEEIFPGVRTMFTPGHTVGHASYTITSGGRRLIAFGDALHSAVQIRHPEWSAGVDSDPAESAVHRHRLVKELQEPDTIGFGVHFADVVFGRVHTTATGPTWHPVA
ncbi:MBL fold metallo-hydrolase [Nonomuraea sp. MG754425]|uniref:MBL fold metallo-hydrolase n=1 Tax=Nonomuraea sp. MG754425 TaxID=2570319 RepID=UPI001F421CEB|nr:MBL fold metallo-hydrolase [Nonomuraea sp. MG754425]MCF6476893.1 MBL fold metallo-hydrolase [Nonomuraea sp. MG754425]